MSVCFLQDSSTCQSSGSWLYCLVCIFWTDARNCPKDAGDTISHVCYGDEFLGVIQSPGTEPVTGATAKLESWKAYSTSKFWQPEVGTCSDIRLHSSTHLIIWLLSLLSLRQILLSRNAHALLDSIHPNATLGSWLEIRIV